MPGSWEDKFNPLITETFSPAENKEWKFALEESKKRGTIQINAREFKVAKVEGGYSGPGKNGFIIPINSKTEVTEFKNALNKFLEDVENFLDE